MNSQTLLERIYRKLGAPSVKVELDPMTAMDNIDLARRTFIKWAVGQSSTDRYYTMLLYSGVSLYDMPSNVLDVLGYEIGGMGSVHQLFSITNYLYNNGMFDSVLLRGMADGYSLVSYHIARDFLDTVRRYVIAPYDYVYHRYSNQLEITPVPTSGSVMTLSTSAGNVSVDSPGFILLRCLIAEGTAENLYDSLWVHDYALALCKIDLGRVRLKFANFNAVGSNVGLALDGDSLLSEGQADKERLEASVKDNEVYEGWGISLG